MEEKPTLSSISPLARPSNSLTKGWKTQLLIKKRKKAEFMCYPQHHLLLNTVCIPPGSAVELHVDVSDVGLAADAGDQRMSVNFSPQLHHKGHTHLRNSHVEGPTIVSEMHKKTPTQLVYQHPFKDLETLSRTFLL